MGKHEASRGWAAPIVAAAMAVVVAAGGTTIFLVAHHDAKSGRHHAGGPGTHTGTGANDGNGSVPVKWKGPKASLQIVSVSPAPGAKGIPFEPTFTLHLNQPLANGVEPTLDPPVAGKWVEESVTTLQFVATAYYPPYTAVKLSIPAGTKDISGGILWKGLYADYTVSSGSTLRLQQLLAELGYMPLNFVPTGTTGVSTYALATTTTRAHATTTTTRPATSTTTEPATTTTTQPPTTTTQPATTTTAPKRTTTTTTPTTTTAPAIGSESTDPAQIPPDAVSGSFAWRFADTPRLLESLWTPGQWNTVTQGAVMQFESAHGLPTDGQAGPRVWRDLLDAVAWRQLDPAPYNYIMVSEGSPETLTLWENGKQVFQPFLVNTGIPESPTEQGTWPVYVRYTSTTMSGYNPDGSYYSDPGIPWVAYFHGGDAIHGYIRDTYGWPQSLGCVEMRFQDAETMFPYDQLGTLVTVY
ncbi:MAG TPA: L,D-transpeptidase family protein [Acidimicrobiales bacterium]|nr:L,D-transpeptidase family protein [Acidimicrobiales bacterium]